MTRYLMALMSPKDRERATRYISAAPHGTRVEFKKAKRTTDQNSMMWLLLTDLSEQLPWHGVRLRSDDYKLLMLSGLKKEMRIVPNIDGTGFVNLGTSSSDLSKSEMSDLIELILAFGANHGVKFTIDGEENAKTAA